MGFVWDRRKIKMLYSRTMSEMSRRIVCLACVENLDGADWGWVGEVVICAAVCICSGCCCTRADFIKASLHPIRSMNKSSKYNASIQL